MVTPVINVGVDLDGVVANYSKMFSELCNKYIGPQCFLVNDNTCVENWNWHLWYPISAEQEDMIWKIIIDTPEFWEKLSVIDEDGWEYFKEKLMNKPNINVYFITSRRRTAGKSLEKQCINWLESIGWKNPQVICNQKKQLACEVLDIDFFIDDYDETDIIVKNYLPDCNVFVKYTKYNEKINLYNKIDKKGKLKYQIVPGLKEFTDFILKYESSVLSGELPPPKKSCI